MQIVTPLTRKFRKQSRFYCLWHLHNVVMTLNFEQEYTAAAQLLTNFAPVFAHRAAAFLKARKFTHALQVIRFSFFTINGNLSYFAGL